MLLTYIFFELTFPAVKLIAVWVLPKALMGMVPVFGLCDLGVLIWGSVVVFGSYGDWTYDESEKKSDVYCAYTAYMCPFVIMIIKWLTLPLYVYFHIITAWYWSWTTPSPD